MMQLHALSDHCSVASQASQAPTFPLVSWPRRPQLVLAPDLVRRPQPALASD
jgi:hypothetical protein